MVKMGNLNDPDFVKNNKALASAASALPKPLSVLESCDQQQKDNFDAVMSVSRRINGLIDRLSGERPRCGGVGCDDDGPRPKALLNDHLEMLQVEGNHLAQIHADLAMLEDLL